MTIIDETLGGQRLRSFTIADLNEKCSVRDIIRARIWQEVQDYNSQRRQGSFAGLVQPTDHEARINQKQPRPFKEIDWQQQYETALRAFATNGFFILIGERQATELDEEFIIEPETEVSFVKLVPLVGG